MGNKIRAKRENFSPKSSLALKNHYFRSKIVSFIPKNGKQNSREARKFVPKSSLSLKHRHF